MSEFDPEIWIPQFIKNCYIESLKLGRRDWSTFPEQIEETVYAVTPVFMDYKTWMLYKEKDREKMRKMWGKYSYKQAKKFIRG